MEITVRSLLDLRSASDILIEVVLGDPCAPFEVWGCAASRVKMRQLHFPAFASSPF